MDGFEPAAEGVFPAYKGWGTNKMVTAESDGHCQSGDEFCFLCEFEGGSCPDDNGSDLREDLDAMIRSMIQNHQEPKVIARKAAEAYRTSIQQFVHYVDDKGQEVRNPAWSRASVERHLMYSTEYSGVFDMWLERSHRSMLMRQGNVLIKSDGRVCPVAQKEFSTTLKSYIDMRKSFAKR